MIITAYKGSHAKFHATVRDANGDTVTFESGDVMRIRIGKIGQTPLLTLTSAAASANGSTILGSNPTVVQIVAADIASIGVGVWDVEIGFVDDSDSDRYKHADTGLFAVHDTFA